MTEPDVKEAARIAREAEARIPFNRVLGLKLEEIGPEESRISFAMRDELVGNAEKGSLHGGVISATLDAVGGLAAVTGAGSKSTITSVAELFGRLGTIDLRVDYLRPGVGEHFEARAWVLRAGGRIAVTRMELHADDDTLIAVGTGTYIVG